MSRIGIIGFGFMGHTHMRAYAGDPRARVVAIADARPEATSQGGAGNLIAVDDAAIDLSGVFVTNDPQELLACDDVDAVSICTPTPTHRALAVAAIKARKHVLIEKPLALTSDQAAEVMEAASRSDRCIMPAMCIRFWPEWAWLKHMIDIGTYGRLLSAVFTRLGARPGWGQDFYADPAKSGGAILDLHIHDVDFIRWCFGEPNRLNAVGIEGPRGGIDHLVTSFEFADGPMVAAQGGWIRAGDFPFTMRYTVEFEKASVVFDLAHSPTLSVYSTDGCTHPAVEEGDGYVGEIASFLDCIERGRPPEVTLEDAAAAIALIEAERQSIVERAWVQPNMALSS